MYTCKETVTWYFNITYSYILTRSEYEIYIQQISCHVQVRVLTHNKSDGTKTHVAYKFK